MKARLVDLGELVSHSDIKTRTVSSNPTSVIVGGNDDCEKEGHGEGRGK